MVSLQDRLKNYLIIIDTISISLQRNLSSWLSFNQQRLMSHMHRQWWFCIFLVCCKKDRSHATCASWKSYSIDFVPDFCTISRQTCFYREEKSCIWLSPSWTADVISVQNRLCPWSSSSVTCYRDYIAQIMSCIEKMEWLIQSNSFTNVACTCEPVLICKFFTRITEMSS